MCDSDPFDVIVPPQLLWISEKCDLKSSLYFFLKDVISHVK